MNPKKLTKLLLKQTFYMQSIDIIVKQHCKEWPECYAKYFLKT